MICRICHNSSNNRAFKVREMMYGLGEVFTYYECSTCGCLQLAEIPKDMARYYPSDYLPRQPVLSSGSLRRLLTAKRDRYALFHRGLLGRLLQSRYPNELLSLLARTGATTRWRVLDVGCGNGTLLSMLEDLGFTDLTGVDPYVGQEVDRGALRILRKTVHDLPRDARFHLIVANHSLEHIENQSETLSAFRSLLDEDGRCFIRIPVKSDHIWKTYGIDWVQIDAPRHFFIHTLNSFEHLAREAGLAIFHVDFDSSEFQFWGSEQYRKGIPLRAENSYAVNANGSIFSRREIRRYRAAARELNRVGQGDQATFHLRKTVSCGSRPT